MERVDEIRVGRGEVNLNVLATCARGLTVRFDRVPGEPQLRLLATMGVVVRVVGQDGEVMEAAAHEILAVRDCKIPACVDEAEDKMGRFAGLCSRHKKEAIEAAHRDGTWGGAAAAGVDRRLAVSNGPTLTAAHDLVRIARELRELARDPDFQGAAKRLLAAARDVERVDQGVRAAQRKREQHRVELAKAYVEFGRACGLLKKQPSQLRSVA